MRGSDLMKTGEEIIHIVESSDTFVQSSHYFFRVFAQFYHIEALLFRFQVEKTRKHLHQFLVFFEQPANKRESELIKSLGILLSLSSVVASRSCFVINIGGIHARNYAILYRNFYTVSYSLEINNIFLKTRREEQSVQS